MFYECKRLYNGFASIRDYIVEDCIRRRQDLIILWQGHKMRVPWKELVKPVQYQIHRTPFRSKFDPSKKYELYDFFYISGKGFKN